MVDQLPWYAHAANRSKWLCPIGGIEGFLEHTETMNVVQRCGARFRWLIKNRNLFTAASNWAKSDLPLKPGSLFAVEAYNPSVFWVLNCLPFREVPRVEIFKPGM